MTVSKLAAAAGIAKGSFYSFFESKEAFILALCGYAGEKTQVMFMKQLQGRSQMTTHEFMDFIREYMNSEYDLIRWHKIKKMYHFPKSYCIFYLSEYTKS